MTTTMSDPKKCRLLTSLLTISICFWTSCAQLDSTTIPEVTIRQGTLQGVVLRSRHGRNFPGFLGIPFAEPPVGDLRFANPVPARRWNGTQDASTDMNVCPQISGNEVLGDEDCLYLNVYTPQLPASTNTPLLPVMVYIPGGAFSAGSARSDRYSPVYFLDQDVVLVIPNYRIGPLGFLSTGDEIASGNWALKDQVLALEWVQDNIKYFGGDPEQVTLFGQSAGGVSVHLLTLSNSTIGLFHRYITQSGSALAPWAYQPRATYASRAFQLGEYVGCSNDTSDSLINCLRTVPFSNILATQPRFLVWRNFPTIVWTPTVEPDIEGAILTDSPTNLFLNGNIRDQPWISGITRDEGLMLSVAFYEDEEMLNDFLKNIDLILPEMLSLTSQADSGAAWVSAIKSYYFNNELTTNTSVLLSNITQLLTDALFHYPAYDALQQQLALAKNPEYYYTFNYRGTQSRTSQYGNSTTDYGVTHGDDMIYLLPSELFVRNDNGSRIETDFEVVDAMVQLWTSFAINGTPTYLALNGTARWEPYSMGENYLRIGNESDGNIEVEKSLSTQRMQFWVDLTTTSVTAAAATYTYSNFFVILVLICSKIVLSV